MLNYDEIREEIARLEHSPTTYANVEKLAMLYQVINNAPDHSERSAPIQNYSYAPDSGSSEFVQTFKKAPIDDALKVIDEHMSAIAVLYPREYDAVLRKLNGLN